MKISKQDALTWFRFFAELPEDEDLLPHQQEIAWAVFSQIEEAVDDRFRRLKAQIRGLKTIGGRTFFVGDETLECGGIEETGSPPLHLVGFGERPEQIPFEHRLFRKILQALGV